MFIAGCGDGRIENDYIYDTSVYEDRRSRQFDLIDEEILPYYKRFEETFGREIGDIPANFVKLAYPVAGMCYYYADGRKEIHIDLRIWDKYDDIGKEAIVFHELGHCLLMRQHNNNLTNLGRYEDVPESVMNSVLPLPFLYKKFHDHYISELSGNSLSLTEELDESKTVPAEENSGATIKDGNRSTTFIDKRGYIKKQTKKLINFVKGNQ